MTKQFESPCNQGEVRFTRLPGNTLVPKDATKIAAVGGLVIVSHSETGHHHVMTADKTDLYQLPGDLLACLMVVKDPDELKHLRDFDTHEPISFPPGKYQVRRLREYIPGGFRAQSD